MRPDHTHVTVILDRTGSMEAIRDDTIGGFNAFLRAQRNEPGQATLTLVQFDTQDPYEIVHRFKPLADVPELTRETFVPRASTPLLDAMGRGINDLEKSLHELPDSERPSRVVMVIVTDGQENSSREFRKNQISKMIEEKRDRAGWQFVFLSADLNAIDDAVSLGVRPAAVLLFEASHAGTTSAWESASRRIAEYRGGRSSEMAFTDEDRKAQRSSRRDKT